MRNEDRRLEGSTFAIEKMLAAIYVGIFVAIVGAGAYIEIARIMSDKPERHLIASTEPDTP